MDLDMEEEADLVLVVMVVEVVVEGVGVVFHTIATKKMENMVKVAYALLVAMRLLEVVEQPVMGAQIMTVM